MTRLLFVARGWCCAFAQRLLEPSPEDMRRAVRERKARALQAARRETLR